MWHACTDVTGFGFLGHLHEMMEGSHTSAKIDTTSIPIFQEAITCAHRVLYHSCRTKKS